MKHKSGKIISAVKLVAFATAILMALSPFAWAKSKESKTKMGKAEVPQFKVMTRNLYLGADIFKVVEAAQTDPNLVPYAVADVYQTMLFTNFWERAEAIADEIAHAKPQVVGLQEVSAFYTQTPGDFMTGNPVAADHEVIDFYKVLDAALKARKMYYKPFVVTNADVELPMIDPDSPTYLSDVRMVDHDVILVRKGYPAVEVMTGNYGAALGLNLGGVDVEFTRGFGIVDVTIKGFAYRFVNTHLEIQSAPDSVFRIVQYNQMLELLGTIDFIEALYKSKPVILVGDLNSDPEDVPGYGLHPDDGYLPYVPPYMVAADAGYLDTWLLQKKYDEGYTSGFDEYVSDPNATLTTRIDHVFLDPKGLRVNSVKSVVVGDEIEDMTPSGFWPSDHAGVVSKIKLVKPKKHPY